MFPLFTVPFALLSLVDKDKKTYLVARLDTPCPVPRPHYSARPKRFGSRAPSENVFQASTPRIRQ